MSKFVNLKVTAHLTAPVVVSDYIRLDSLISCGYAKELLGDDFFKANNNQHESEQVVIDTLSNIIEFDENLHVFHASFGVFEDTREFQTCYSKRLNTQHEDIIRFQGKGKKEIDTTRGQFKAYRNTLIYKSAPTIDFFARGNIGKIKDLLQNITFVGKKSSQGYGAVSNWSVFEIEDDLSIVNQDGKLMRNVPAEYIDGDKIATNTMTLRFDTSTATLRKMSTIPPAYRDEQYLCYTPK